MLAGAEDLAQAADVAVIGPQHLAVALLAEPDGIAAQAIAALGVGDGQLRSAFGLPGPAGTTSAPAAEPAGGGPAAERVPLGPGALAALNGALRAALHLGHNYIGTEHILLGLVDSDDATAATLAGLGVTKAAAQQQITMAFAEIAASRPGSGAPRTWMAGRSRENNGMYGTCFSVARVT